MESQNKKAFLILGVLSIFFLGATIPLLIQWVSSASKKLVFVQGANEYLTALIWAIVLAGVISLFRMPWKIKRHFMWIWALRCIVTLFLMLFYESFYKLDAYEYFKNILSRSYINELQFNRGTNFVVYLGAFFDDYLPIGQSYHAYKVIWSFIGLIGIIPFYKIYQQFTGKDNVRVIWFLGAFPSIIFWTSILGKDPLAIFGIGYLAYGLLRIHDRVDIAGFIYIAIGTLLLCLMRTWLIPIFTIPAILSFTFTKSDRFVWKIVGVSMISCLAGYVLINLQEMLYLTTEAEAFETINTYSSSWAVGGSAMRVATFRSIGDILQFLPIGFFTAIFRPLPGDVNNIFGIIAGIESLFILIIFLRSLYYMKRKYWSNGIILYSWAAIIVWGSFYAFISYQNLGTAVRFRAQILPFLLLMPYFIDYLRSKDKLNTPKRPERFIDNANTASL